MWWNDPNFDKSIDDKNGRTWSFKVWHDFVDGVYLQKIFFWDSNKEITGILEFKDGQTIHRKKIKDRILKLVKDKAYREKYICALQFPIEKNY